MTVQISWVRESLWCCIPQGFPISLSTNRKFLSRLPPQAPATSLGPLGERGQFSYWRGREEMVVESLNCYGWEGGLRNWKWVTLRVLDPGQLPNSTDPRCTLTGNSVFHQQKCKLSEYLEEGYLKEWMCIPCSKLPNKKGKKANIHKPTIIGKVLIDCIIALYWGTS